MRDRIDQITEWVTGQPRWVQALIGAVGVGVAIMLGLQVPDAFSWLAGGLTGG